MKTLKSCLATPQQCINKMGTTQSMECHYQILKIWEWAISRKNDLPAAHIPGKLLKGCSQNLLKGDIQFRKLSTTMIGQERKCLYFGRVDTVKFGIQILEPSTWVSHEKLQRFTFIHKYKCSYLPVNKFEKCTLAGAFMIKYGCQHCSAKQVSCKVMYLRWLILVFLMCFIWLLKNQLLNVFSIFFRYPQESDQQVSRKNNNLQRVSWDVTLNLKKQHIYYMYTLVKILQTSCLTTIECSTCQGKLS